MLVMVTRIEIGGWLRRCWVLAVLLALQAPGFAQYDPAAPEPIAWPRGSLVLVGPGQVSAAAVERLSTLSVGDAGLLAVLVADPAAFEPAEDPVAADPVWRERRVLHVGSRGAANAPELSGFLDAVTAVWIPDQDADLATLWSDTTLARSLERLVQRGGVVGAHGTSATALGTRLPDRAARNGLGLLPGAVVVTGADLGTLEEQLKHFLPSHRELVGYAVPAGGALVVQRRRIAMADKTPGSALIAPWRDKPWRIESLDHDSWMDLVLLSRAAVSRTLPPFPPAPPPRTEVKNGTLILAGGAGTPAGLLERFVELAGGPDAPIVFIPAAGSDKLPVEPATVERLRRAGARNVSWIHTKDRQRANSDEAILGPLRDARGIWFGGGRHWNFVDSYLNTTAHRLMHAVLERGGVIGGSSAGASIQSDYMSRGDPRGNRSIMAEGYERGLGFLPGSAIDQHFSERSRLPEMAWLVTNYPQLLGIGLDEQTALIVQGRVAEVLSDRPDSRVFFFGHNKPTRPSDQRYDALANGERYDLVRRGRIYPRAGSADGN